MIKSGKYLQAPSELAVEISKVFETKPTRKQVADYMSDKFGTDKNKPSSEDFIDTLDSVMNDIDFYYSDDEIESSRKPIKSSINTEIVKDFPAYMVYYATYGEPGGNVTDEDIAAFEKWRKRKGYGDCLGFVDDDPEQSFDSHPAFGLACDTVPVIFEVEKSIESSRKPIKSSSLIKPYHALWFPLPFYKQNNKEFNFNGLEVTDEGMRIHGYDYSGTSTNIDVFGNFVEAYDTKHHINCTGNYDVDLILDFVRFFKENIDFNYYLNNPNPHADIGYGQITMLSEEDTNKLRNWADSHKFVRNSRRPVKSWYVGEPENLIGNKDYRFLNPEDFDGYEYVQAGNDFYKDLVMSADWELVKVNANGYNTFVCVDTDKKLVRNPTEREYFLLKAEPVTEDVYQWMKRDHEKQSRSFLGVVPPAVIKDYLKGYKQVKSSRKSIKSSLTSDSFEMMIDESRKMAEDMYSKLEDWWVTSRIGQDVVYFIAEHNDYSVRVRFEFIDSGFCYVSKTYTNGSYYEPIALESWKYEGLSAQEIESKILNVLENFFPKYNEIESSKKAVKSAAEKDYSQVVKLCEDLQAYPGGKLPPAGIYKRLLEWKSDSEKMEIGDVRDKYGTLTAAEWIKELKESV